MIISINAVREILEIRLGPNDSLSARTIQSRLRNGKIPFSTVRFSGHWSVDAGHIVNLAQTLESFNPVWDAAALDRLHQVQHDLMLDLVSQGFAPALSHQLRHVGELGLSPYPEQFDAATMMSAPTVRRFALFWKPGSGKTGAMISAAHELLSNGTVGGVMVVAERPLAIQNPWVKELGVWLPQRAACADVSAVSGNRAARIKAYQEDSRWAIVHYGILDRDQFAIREWAARRRKVERPILIFDESDFIKNSGSQRSRAAIAIRPEFGRCWIASGTPAPNSPSDYEHQLTVVSGYPIDLGLTGDRPQDALTVVHELQRGFYYLQRENPRKMPETITPVSVQLSGPQREEYDRIAGILLSDLQEMDDATFAAQYTSIMARRMALLRLCSDPGHDQLPNPIYDSPSKWSPIDDLLESILRTPDEKTVIWTRFRSTAISLHKRYASMYGAALMIGGGEGSPRDLYRPECRLLVATIQVGASSIDLTAARNAIYESIDDVSRNLTQSLARINRTGQIKDCRYWFLVTKKSVEEDLFDNSMAKMQLADEVLSEIGKPGRSEMIDLLRRNIAGDFEGSPRA